MKNLKVNCLCPEIILNPLAKELISLHGNYFIRNVKHSVVSSKILLYDFKVADIHPQEQKITKDILDDCFVLDYSSGERYPLYLQVPCGHCDICKKSKVDSLVFRCKLETYSYKCKPIFLTLTYDEKHLPKDGVNLRDVQLFFKRLRINLFRRGYRQKCRYLLVSEYGKRKRAHYHAILWNLHQTDLLSYCEIRKILKDSWNQGFIYTRFIDPCDDKTFRYTAKYLCKPQRVPDGKRPNFKVSSNRSGGIGAPCIDKLASHIASRLDVRASVCNPFTLKSEPIQFNRYILNRIFPSFSGSLPVGFKTACREFMFHYSILKNFYNYENKEFEKIKETISSVYGQFFYCPFLESSEIKVSLVNRYGFHMSKVLKSEIVLRRFRPSKRYLESCRANGQRRDCFLFRLFEVDKDVDLKHKSYLFRRSVARSLELEIL